MQFETVYLTWIGYVLVAVFAMVTAGHALVYKRDVRATIAWVGFILVLPLVGATLYWLLGVNRIQRKAWRLRGKGSAGRDFESTMPANPAGRFAALARLGNTVSDFPLTAGNVVEPLIDGDAAYPVMLEAIANARSSISLALYIFDRDEVGRSFRDLLVAAIGRGVEVRVLVDAVGGGGLFGATMADELRELGVDAAEFMPVSRPRRLFAFNLRNHRKSLIVDGRVAFTGGMNVSAGNVLATPGRLRRRDLQFRIEGPVVGQLQQVFVDDWNFTTGEALAGETWFPPLQAEGAVLARAVPDGPDEDFEVLRMLMLGALAEARGSVAVMTPYFLPDAALISALNTAALRGISVDIVLPSASDHPLVHWASRAVLWQVLDRGCRVWYSPPPFDHSKLMIVDDTWTLIGSTNWDPRSLRLNFELNVECYDPAFAARMRTLFEARKKTARSLVKSELDDRPLPIKLRDGAARLLTPYL